MGLWWLSYLTELFDDTTTQTLAGWNTVGRGFALLEDAGGLMTDRNWDAATLFASECNFPGYSRVALGTLPGAWDSWSIIGNYVQSAAHSATWAYDSGGSGDNTRIRGDWVVFYTYDGTDYRIVFAWQVASPVTFNADGQAATYELKLRLLNAADVV